MFRKICSLMIFLLVALPLAAQDDGAARLVRTGPNKYPVTTDTLPQLFSGPIGAWQTGTLIYAYPEDWFSVVLLDSLFLMNTNELVPNARPVPGDIQVRFAAPDYNMLPFESESDIQNCTQAGTNISPLAVIREQIIGSPEAVDALIERGVAFSEPEPVQTLPNETALMRLWTPERDMLVVTVEVGPGYVVGMTAYTAPGEMVNFEDTLLEIAATLGYEPDGCG